VIRDEKDLEIAKLNLLLKKSRNSVKNYIETAAYYNAALEYERKRLIKLEREYDKLNERFEANFKFHEYIKDVLDQTADLMENYDAVREQDSTVQERVQATSQKRRTRKSNGAPAGA